MGLGPPRVTRTPRDTYPTELTPDTGLSHWWAMPLVVPRTPRLGGDRLGCFYGRLGGLVVGVSLFSCGLAFPVYRPPLPKLNRKCNSNTSGKNNSNSSNLVSRGSFSV